MRFSIGHKVFATVFMIVTAAVGMVLGLTHLSINRGFTDYIHQVDLTRTDELTRNLESFYSQNGDWSQLPSQDLGRWLGQRLGWPNPPAPGPSPGSQPPRRLLDRVGILSSDGQLVAGAPESLQSTERKPIIVQGQVVGYLTLLPFQRDFSRQDHAFLHAQMWNLLWLGLAALGLSLFASILLARNIRRPVGELVEGTRQLATGNFAHRLSTRRQDELGQLAQDFNLLAQALESHERSRRQWVADTSHELRTPLAVLRAQVEALQDGVHEPDERTLSILHSEIMGLEKLVEDLHRLARLDEGLPSFQMGDLDPADGLMEAVDAFRERFDKAGLSLEVDTQAVKGATLLAAGDQLRRLYANLLENTLRYTDPGGRLRIECRSQGLRLLICFEDSAPGVPEGTHDLLFDRFYRVDASRSRDQGGSGLGLSICRSIVEAHLGTIQASASALGGVRIDIDLPYRSRGGL